MKLYLVGYPDSDYRFAVRAENRIRAIELAAKYDGSNDPAKSARSGYWKARVAKAADAIGTLINL